MDLASGKADGNSARSIRVYQQKYPNHRVPCANTIFAVDHRVLELEYLYLRKVCMDNRFTDKILCVYR